MAEELELINFKASKRFIEKLREDSCKCDVALSKFIRAAIMLGSDTLRSKPYLINILDRNNTRNGNGVQ